MGNTIQIHPIGIDGKKDQRRQNSINSKNTYVNSNALAKGKDISFQGGFVDTLSLFVNKVEESKAVEFIALDFFFVILPRLVQAAFRNAKELGHLNYKYLTEEGVKEFLTGPSMFLISMAVLFKAKDIFGAASNIRFNTLESFTKSFTDAAKNPENLRESEKLKKSFYKQVFSNLFDNTGIKAEDVNLDNLVKKIVNISNNQKEIAEVKKGMSWFERFKQRFGLNKNPKIEDLNNRIKDLNKEIQKTVIELNKATKELANLNDSAKLAINENKEKVSVSKLVSDLIKYGEDVVEKCSQKIKNGGNIQDIIEKAHKFRKGGRVITTSFALISTAAFLWSIPEIYTRVNKKFPGVDGLAKNQDQAKECV